MPFTALCQQVAAATLHADLHTHSTASDGTRTPAEVVTAARVAGLQVVALTDHDTVAGLSAARTAVAGVRVVTGVEITTRWADLDVHVLGYDFDPTHPHLTALLAELQNQRQVRFAQLCARLRTQGCTIAEDWLPAPSPGRRHLAAHLAATGQAQSVGYAFRKWIEPASVGLPVVGVPVPDAIAALHAAGGWSSWAHPPTGLTTALLRQLVGHGLDGLEVNYPGRKAGVRRMLRDLATPFGLRLTGGSDSHGDRHHALGAAGLTLGEWEKLSAKSGELSAVSDQPSAKSEEPPRFD
jgi:hypothetical protein